MTTQRWTRWVLGAALGLAPWMMPTVARAQAPAGAAVREVEVVVDGGYQPTRVEVVAGERVWLRFVRRDYGGCTREVLFATLGLRRELPTGRPVTVDLPALPADDTPFECGMGMVRGVAVVRAAPAAPGRASLRRWRPCRPDRATVPALGFRALTPLYDLVIRLTTREALFRDRLVRAAAVVPGERVLDLACSTGSTSVLLQQRQPAAMVCGLDIDPEVLARARRKADRLALPIRFEQRSATDPLDDLGPFDVAVSSLFFHHLDDDVKVCALANVRAALRDGGRLHVVDWERPSGLRAGLGFRVVRLLDGAQHGRERAAPSRTSSRQSASATSPRPTASTRRSARCASSTPRSERRPAGR